MNFQGKKKKDYLERDRKHINQKPVAKCKFIINYKNGKW